jgi:cytochrome c5
MPLRHLRAACLLLVSAASCVVSVSMTSVYNGVDFVCAIYLLLDKCHGNDLDHLPIESSTFPIPDEVDLMKKLLTVAAALMLSLSAQAAQDPEAVYARACGVCHNGQLPMAPKRGDQAAWEPRLAKGMDALVLSATNGLNAMPPRGLCMDCTAEDYQAVIKLMIE